MQILPIPITMTIVRARRKAGVEGLILISLSKNIQDNSILASSTNSVVPEMQVLKQTHLLPGSSRHSMTC